jgi:hypothetical protein
MLAFLDRGNVGNAKHLLEEVSNAT